MLDELRTMLELRGTGSLRVLYISQPSYMDAERMSSGRIGFLSEWMVVSSLDEALALLHSEPSHSYNLNLIIFHIAALAAEPHLCVKVLAFAPVAARVLMYESPTDRAVMEMSPLFDMTCPRPDSGVLRPEALYWYRAGMSGTLRAFNEVPTAFAFVHKETKFVLCVNQAALSLLSTESFDGGTLSDLIELPEEAFVQNPWRGDIALSDQPHQVLGVSVRTLEKVWLFVSLRDITAIYADREERRQDEGRMILGRAAAVLAHEVSNPLAAIKSTLQLLGGVGANFTKKEVDEYVARALREIERLSTIVKSYLSIVRPPANMDEVWSLRELVESAGVYMDDYLRTVGITCTIQPIDPDLRVHFGADQFKQIVWNIAKNAVDSILKNRTSEPRLEVGYYLKGQNMVSVYFDDNGEGLDPGLLEKVFEPYFTSKGSSGTGLGLTICRLLAGRYKATLTLRNNDTGGARAILSMRLAKS